MDNTIEVFQPEYTRLSLPAGAVTVFIDGIVRDDIEPVEMVRSSWPEFSWVKLAYRPPATADSIYPDIEQLAEQFRMGQTVSLRQTYSRNPGESAIAGIPVFSGHIEGVEAAINSHGPSFEIVAKDFSAALGRITVYGQRVRQDDGETTFLAGLDTAFNPQGQGNMTAASVRVGGKIYPAFEANERQAVSWGCAEAITYLLGEYAPLGSVYYPGLDQLRALAGGRAVRDLDVTGLSLLDAVRRCCDVAGLRFQFVPRNNETGPDQAIVFYCNGHGRTIEVNYQSFGQSLSLSRTNIATMQSQRDFHPITNRYIGRGDFRTYEATFELVGAWDPALWDPDYAKFSPTSNPQFHEVKDVFRKWCLNEAGDYTPLPYDRGESYDFSTLFEGAAFVRKRRRFWPALSTDRQGQSLGYVLEVSLDGGIHWRPYVSAFNNLLTECGIWLSSDQLDVDTWVAGLKGLLKFRITASVISDERLTCVVADGPVGSTVPVVDHVVTLPRQFRYRKISPQSVFAQTDAQAPSASNVADDTDALYDLLRGRAETSLQTVETTEIQTPTLALHISPGDQVTSAPEGRDILACRHDNRSLVWIERVQMDFRKQCTRLKTVRQRV